MEQILFVFPAKAVLCDRPRRLPRFVTFRGFRFMVYDGLNVWLEDGKVRSRNFVLSQYTPTWGSYFIEIKPDVFVSANNHRDDNGLFATFQKLTDDAIKTFIDGNLAILADIPAYNERAGKEAKDRREANQREQAEREEKRRLAAELAAKQRMERGRADWIANNGVTWDVFEDLCKENGIIIPIQTLGCGRKHISELCRNSITIAKQAKSDGVWLAIWALNEALKEHKSEHQTEVITPEIEQLFKGV